MKEYRSALPPLDYLLFFEAVARHGSFTDAARELNVSQAAVSKRVKVLEEWTGLSLVRRRGRNIALTRNGMKLSASTSEALEYLTMCFQQMRRATDGDRLSLAANVAVSQFWLIPRINEYLLGQDAVPVTLTSSDKDSDLLALEADAFIYYGADIPVGWDGACLFEEVWVPVAAPGQVGATRSLAGATLLDFDKLTPKWINWDGFAELTRCAGMEDAAKVNLGAYGSTVDTALRGKGVALGCVDVLQSEIEAGRLEPLIDYQLRTGRSYFVIWRPGTMTERTHELLTEVGITF